ncbi:SET domain-containing protein [Clavulina sp. PMI_390]|nr:SET domain-containing protein [Clavulina sp. PMI_390]
MPRKSTPAVPVNPIYIPELPRAEEDAFKTFERIPGNTYQNASLGRAPGQDEGTACDCQFVPGMFRPQDACGEGSNCINRLTLVECIDGDCPSRSHCQNRRFQQKQYADIGIVQTEKKGFGLRAESQIEQDGFIYEYIGEVVKEAEFMKRMARYAQEGIRHFYFMMLQREQFIDATKKGNIGRFANHSCNPNCYVAKWFVGNKVRMGIFAKRTIYQHEELTFNYNVDRYGHDAQTCYCGEPNCVGFIGGTTQTDIGGMDDLYIEALGIMDDVEKYTLKGNRRKKSKKLDEDYLPPMNPMVEDEVPVVVQALRQASSSNLKLLPHLLTRLELTVDPDALRSLMRLRGFSLMHSLLGEHGADTKLTRMILVSLKSWPLLNRNKVEDSKIEEPIQQIIAGGEPELRSLAQGLLEWWGTLETAYRIPKRAMQLVDGQPLRLVAVTERASKRPREEEAQDDLPTFKYTAAPKTVRMAEEVYEMPVPVPAARPAAASKADLAAIIARATEAAEAAKAEEVRRAQEAEEAAEKKRLAKQRRAERAERASSSKPVDKDKIVLKLVGEVVVKYMSHYKNQLEHETFKKHAKELTHLIAEKEKKSQSYKEGNLTSLSDEKRKKMKKFIIDYVKSKLQR